MALVLAGYGPSPHLLTQGYTPATAAPGPAVLLRETFRVPLPDGPEATRYAPTGRLPYLGSLESGITFALDYADWLGATETIVGHSAVVWADPFAAGSVPYDATASVVQAHTVAGTAVQVTFHQTVAQTFYVTTTSVQTSAGRTLACRMPRLWCPD